MGRSHRFERLEKKRAPDTAPAPAGGGVAGRFGDVPPRPPEATFRASSGGEPGRFEPSPVDAAQIRVLDDREQHFIRCAECRADSHPTATRCGQCGADFATTAQRAFNEAFWRRRLEEKAEEDRELEELRARRQQADREDAEASRYLLEMRYELHRRTVLGPGEGLVEVARAAGHAIGHWLRSRLPGRNRNRS